MTKERYLNMMIGMLEVAKMLYNDEESGFIALNPYASRAEVHLREREFRMFFGKNYTVDEDDPCRISTIYNGTRFFTLTDKPEF